MLIGNNFQSAFWRKKKKSRFEVEEKNSFDGEEWNLAGNFSEGRSESPRGKNLMRDLGFWQGDVCMLKRLLKLLTKLG